MTNNVIEKNEENSDEDEPPPLPPPRHESLNHNYEGPPVDKPLPTIPNSTSLNVFPCNDEDSERVKFNIISLNIKIFKIYFKI